MNRSDVTIVVGYDGGGRSESQAPVAARWIEKQGYGLHLEKVEPRPHYLDMKTDILQPVFGQTKYMVWMDADSILVNPIDDLFTDDWDVALVVKEPGMPSKLHGDYVYGGFSAWNNTPQAKWFLDQYALHRERSDQKELHTTLEPYGILNDEIFEQAGEIIQTEDFRLKLLDGHRFVNLKCIQEMKPWTDDVSILHFKGGLGRRWVEYADRYLGV